MLLMLAALAVCLLLTGVVPTVVVSTAAVTVRMAAVMQQQTHQQPRQQARRMALVTPMPHAQAWTPPQRLLLAVLSAAAACTASPWASLTTRPHSSLWVSQRTLTRRCDPHTAALSFLVQPRISASACWCASHAVVLLRSACTAVCWLGLIG
jgi:hypothetical protein